MQLYYLLKIQISHISYFRSVSTNSNYKSFLRKYICKAKILLQNITCICPCFYLICASCQVIYNIIKIDNYLQKNIRFLRHIYIVGAGNTDIKKMIFQFYEQLKKFNKFGKTYKCRKILERNFWKVNNAEKLHVLKEEHKLENGKSFLKLYLVICRIILALDLASIWN